MVAFLSIRAALCFLGVFLRYTGSFRRLPCGDRFLLVQYERIARSSVLTWLLLQTLDIEDISEVEMIPGSILRPPLAL